MTVYDGANALARAIEESEESREYRRLKAAAEEDDTNRALLTEYKRLQTALQLQAMGGPQVESDDMQRFSQIGSLLYMNADVQAYLMAELRLQKMMGDIFKILSEAGGLSFELPGA